MIDKVIVLPDYLIFRTWWWWRYSPVCDSRATLVLVIRARARVSSYVPVHVNLVAELPRETVLIPAKLKKLTPRFVRESHVPAVANAAPPVVVPETD